MRLFDGQAEAEAHHAAGGHPRGGQCPERAVELQLVRARAREHQRLGVRRDAVQVHDLQLVVSRRADDSRIGPEQRYRAQAPAGGRPLQAVVVVGRQQPPPARPAQRGHGGCRPQTQPGDDLGDDRAQPVLAIRLDRPARRRAQRQRLVAESDARGDQPGHLRRRRCPGRDRQTGSDQRHHLLGMLVDPSHELIGGHRADARIGVGRPDD